MRILIVSEELGNAESTISLLRSVLEASSEGSVIRAVDYHRASVSTFFPVADLVLFDVSFHNEVAGPLLRYLQAVHRQVACLTGPSAKLAQDLQSLGSNVVVHQISEALAPRDRAARVQSVATALRLAKAA